MIGESGHYALLAHLRFAGASFGAPVTLHVTSDFAVADGHENSHSLKPFICKITGFWGNHEGSMPPYISIPIVPRRTSPIDLARVAIGNFIEQRHAVGLGP